MLYLVVVIGGVFPVDFFFREEKTMDEAYRLKRKLNKAMQEEISKWKVRRTFEEQKRDFTRETKLTVETMVRLMLTMEGGVLEDEIPKAGLDVTPAAISQRRKALYIELFNEIFYRFNRLCDDNKLYKGYRVLAVDGTAINIARNPNDKKTFIKTKKNPRGYNQMTVTIVYDVLSKTFVEYDLNRDERGALEFMLDWNDDFTYGHGKPLFVCDRGYESYFLLGHFLSHKDADFLIRVKQGKGAMREIAKLPMEELDTDLDFTITTTQTNADKAAGYVFIQTQKKGKQYSEHTRAARWNYGSPFRMKFRVVRIKLDNGNFETLITSLPRSITVENIKELYHSRWGIELAFRELKYSIALNRIHGRSKDFAMQELVSAFITANYVSRLASTIVIDKKNTRYEYALNRRKAVRLCKEYLRRENADGKELVEMMSRYLVAVRPDRANERNLKPKSFHGFVYRIPS